MGGEGDTEESEFGITGEHILVCLLGDDSCLLGVLCGTPGPWKKILKRLKSPASYLYKEMLERAENGNLNVGPAPALP